MFHPSGPTFLPLADTKPKALTRRARWAALDPLQLQRERVVNASFLRVPPPPTDRGQFLSTLFLVLVLLRVTCGLSIAQLPHRLRDTHEKK